MTDAHPNNIAAGTPVAVQKPPIVVLKERLEARASELRAAMPDVPPEKFIRTVITAAQVNPDLLAASWNSVWLACMRACQAGLLPDGREGAIVVYKDRAQWIPMYIGLLKSFSRNPDYLSVTANCVYDGDEFEHWIDENGEHLRHVPGDKNADKDIRKVYALAKTKSGGVFISVLPLAEINKIRNVSRAKREDSPWAMWFSEMAKKTALRRLAKLLPSAPPIEWGDEDEEESQPLRAVGAQVSQPAAPRRVQGAAAALDLFASNGSPDENSATAEASSASGEQGGGGTATPAGSSARTNVSGDQVAATADAHDVQSDEPQNEQSDDDAIAVAYRRGQDDKQRGASRKALPVEYRAPEREAEMNAWYAGLEGKK